MKIIITLALTALLSSCQTSATASSSDEAGSTETAAVDYHGEPTPYDKTAHAKAAVDAALATARAKRTHSLIVMGANWCHDSRGLAAQFEKPRFQTLISENYELVYVDVGKKNRNIDIAEKFGISEIVGTPTVFVIAPTGDVLNLDTAPTWRNAASRSEDDIYDYFKGFVRPQEN